MEGGWGLEEEGGEEEGGEEEGGRGLEEEG